MLYSPAAFHSLEMDGRILLEALTRRASHWVSQEAASGLGSNLGALIIRIGFGGTFYYNYNKEPPRPYSNYYGPYMRAWRFGLGLRI